MKNKSLALASLITCLASSAFTRRVLAAEPSTQTDVDPKQQSPSALFRSKGQIVIDSSFQISASRIQSEGYGSNNLALMPGAHWFVTNGLSLGANVFYHRQWNDGEMLERATFNSVGISPTLGYDVPIADQVSLWPRLSVSYGYSWDIWEGSWGSSKRDSHGITASAFAPVVLHPAHHFFVGMGPEYWRPIYSTWSNDRGESDSETFADISALSLRTVLGGNF